LSSPSHFVAIIGGAVSGAEAAEVFGQKGIEVAVFEQNDRPYGKIEDGLPRWHDKQRPSEYKRIDEKLARPGVHFVPRTRIGPDIAFSDLQSWGFSAIVLANGAWRDRPLGIDGAEAYLHKGFYYQNPFIYWFNHHHEPDYQGLPCDLAEGAIVVGGGLASLDVVKALMVETLSAALAKKRISVNVIELEHKGCDKILAEHILSLESLGVTPCTLFYRRRVEDMPLASFKEGAMEPEKEKTRQVRAKILDNAMRKYLFKFQGTSRPVGLIMDRGRLAGLRFIRTEIQGEKVLDRPGSEFEVRSPLTISSIGSIPEPIEGIPMKRELYDWRDWDHGELNLGQGIYGLGNVVTGKGNIAVSRKHGQFIAAHVAEAYLGVGGPADGKTSLLEGVASARREEAQALAGRVKRASPLRPDVVEALRKKIRARQQAVGYRSYAEWIGAHPPTS
jgi:hypothetical protein